MRPEQPGDALWDRMNCFERGLVIAGIVIGIILPMTLAFVEMLRMLP